MGSVHIVIAKGVEFAVDQHDILSVEKRFPNGQRYDYIQIGLLTSHLIDQMIEKLNRLRTFAK